MTVAWTLTASTQLQAIHDYLAQSSPGYARSLATRILNRADTLDAQPLLGAEVQEFGDPTIRELFEHPYRVIYRVVGPDVEVIAIIHASRRMPHTPPG